MLYPLSYEGGPGLGQAVQYLTGRRSPSLPTRSEQIVSSEVGEHMADAQVSVATSVVSHADRLAQRAPVDQTAGQVSRVRSSRSGSCWKPADV